MDMKYWSLIVTSINFLKCYQQKSAYKIAFFEFLDIRYIKVQMLGGALLSLSDMTDLTLHAAGKNNGGKGKSDFLS